MVVRVRAAAIAGLVGLTPVLPPFQRLPVRTLTTADGLPRDQLACVTTDSRGFLWFCSEEGLVRFDGYSTLTFGRRQGLDPPGVRTFLHTRDGRYFAGADRGLFEFDPAPAKGRPEFGLLARDDGQRTGAVNALAEAKDGSIWCGTGRGLLRLTRAGGRWHLTEVEIGLTGGVENDRIVRAVVEGNDGTLWVGAGSGVYIRTTDGHTRHLTRAQGLPLNEVASLALDGVGGLWVATRAGLTWIDRAAAVEGRATIVRRHVTERDGLPTSNSRGLYADTDGRTIWDATMFGIAEIRPTATGDVTVGRTLEGFISSAVTTDLRGDVWAATEAGARRLSRRGFTTYIREDGLPIARLSSLFETRAGEVCATSLVQRFELSCYQDGRFNRVAVPAVGPTRDPGWGWSQLTLQDRQGGWWIPTGEGLFHFGPMPVGALTTARPLAVYDQRQGLGSGSIFRLFEDSRGAIWVATFAEENNGVARIDPMTGAVRVFTAGDGLPVNLPIVYAFAEDKSGAVWIGLEQRRVLRCRGDRCEEIPLPDPAGRVGQPTYEHLEALLVDRRGRLWIASTVNGIARFDDPSSSAPTPTWFGVAQGLSSETAWTLAEDDSGDIFVGTGRGVDRLSPATGRLTHYSADDGVPRGEIRGALFDRTGHLWIATTAGAARLETGGVESVKPAAVLVTGVRTAGVPMAIRADGATVVDGITLEPGRGRLDIDFVSPNAREADGLRYQHQLAGVDRDWTATEARTVTLAGLAPGTYRFVVRAILASGVTSNPAEVRFTLLAPVWRRPWFVAGALAGLLALAFGLHRARVTRLLEVERVRSRIAADLHDGVGASLSRIAILSEVVRQQVEPIVPTAVPALASIADNARGVIDDMSDAVWFIDPRIDNLKQLVARVRAMASELCANQPLRASIEGPDQAAEIRLDAEQRRHLYLLVKESLTNVVRHAQAASVTVRLAIQGDRLGLEVADDGVGLAPSNPSPKAGSGRGLASLQARAAALGGTLRIESGPGGRGTRVKAQVPLHPHDRAIGKSANRL